jgi:S1-C subfamily serine protease
MERHNYKTHHHIKRAQFLTIIAIAINLAMFVFMYLMLSNQVDGINSRVDGIRTDLQTLDYRASENFVAMDSNISSLFEELDENTETLNITNILIEQLGEDILESQEGIQNIRSDLNYTGTINEALESVVLIIWTDKSSVLGSGFFISNDGYIATAKHVVDGFDGKTVRVKTRGGDIYIATVEESDEDSDVSILKIDIENAVALELGDSQTLSTGSKVFALGAPEGFSFSASEGIVSAVRNVETIEKEVGLKLGLGKNVFIVQTDAAITHGNSGGPLIDIEGKVVGLNSFGVSRNSEGTYQDIEGLNFAIASKDIKEVYEVALIE